MMNLSFHLEKSFSCWTHMTPFLRQVSCPSTLAPCSELSERDGVLQAELHRESLTDTDDSLDD